MSNNNLVICGGRAQSDVEQYDETYLMTIHEIEYVLMKITNMWQAIVL